MILEESFGTRMWNMLEMEAEALEAREEVLVEHSRHTLFRVLAEWQWKEEDEQISLLAVS